MTAIHGHAVHAHATHGPVGPGPGGRRFRGEIEGIVTGVAYACALVVVGVFAVASFRPGELGAPYWGRITWLRTDTFGVLCFFAAAAAFSVSEYLRLSRRADQETPVPTAPPRDGARLVTMALARSFAVAGTALVVYLSANSFTHPQTLSFQATHLLPWPSEGTLRAVTLVMVAGAVATARTLRIQVPGLRPSGVGRD
jgi:hypothetical protein